MLYDLPIKASHTVTNVKHKHPRVFNEITQNKILAYILILLYAILRLLGEFLNQNLNGKIYLDILNTAINPLITDAVEIHSDRDFLHCLVDYLEF